MKLRGVLMAGAALLVCGLSGSAEAKERLSLYEMNSFLTHLTNAVNNPDPMVGRSFLIRNVTDAAEFHNTVNRTWTDPRYAYAHPVWHNQQVSPYYRYPQPYSYIQPTSFQSVGKTEMVAQFENKKNMIPRYHQSITLLGTRMPADASSAVLDVQMKEYGIGYAPAAYGYYPTAGAKIEHSVATCQINLEKENSQIRMTRMSCTTTMTNAI